MHSVGNVVNNYATYMYDDRCIAVYDSGAGGLNITKRIRERFKSEDIVY